MADSAVASTIPVTASCGDPPAAAPAPVPSSDLPAAPAAKSPEPSPGPVIDPSKEERSGVEHPLPGGSD
uniref:Uncharacterized protein n=1 Tax=Leersia perrieri TaxID=77586 RepID=A0A0D9WRK5_9ORYZ